MIKMNFFTVAIAVLFAAMLVMVMTISESIALTLGTKVLAAMTGYILYFKYNQWKAAGYVNSIEEYAQE